jgi:hypothetical protein
VGIQIRRMGLLDEIPKLSNWGLINGWPVFKNEAEVYFLKPSGLELIGAKFSESDACYFIEATRFCDEANIDGLLDNLVKYNPLSPYYKDMTVRHAYDYTLVTRRSLYPEVREQVIAQYIHLVTSEFDTLQKEQALVDYLEHWRTKGRKMTGLELERLIDNIKKGKINE